MVDSQTTKFLEYATEKLISLGKISLPYKIERHVHQGYMSRVFILSSARGEFVIHIAKPSALHRTNKTWEKLKGINTLVKKETALPVSEMVLAEPVGKTFITAQKRLPGENAGARSILGHSVVDTWFKEKESLILQTQEILAEIHAVKLTGFGLPVLKNGKLEGFYETWQDFFIKEIPVWLESLRQSESGKKSVNNLYAEIADYTEKFCMTIPESPPLLIHGDLANPSNLLVQEGNITGIIDWEWSIIGDPAWEFCDPGWATNITDIGLDTYFRAKKIDTDEAQKAFLKRIIIYRPLWCLWTAYVHRDDEDPIIYDTLCMLMKEALSEIKTLSIK